MIRSMTAYAKAEMTEKQLTVAVEIKTLNSRYLDYQIRLPYGYTLIEEKIKECVSKKISRGRIELRLSIHDEAEETCVYDVNLAKAKAFKEALSTLSGELGISTEIPLSLFTGSQGIITPGESVTDFDANWLVIEQCLNHALDDLNRMRQVEGDYLKKDFSERLDYIESAIKTIEAESADLVPQYQKRLTERIRNLTDGIVELDQARIVQEAAIIADRSDISEEIVRAKSHIKQFRTIMDSPEAGGRKLNFLLQEFNREFNTMGSKAGQASVAHLIVDVKSELERLREQVQNIE